MPHADKSSELVGSTGGADYINENLNDEDFISLSCDPELYDSLGFNSEQMTKEVRAMAKDPANQNPMSGYTFADPNELLIGSVNRYTEHEGWFETWDNYEASSLEELPSYGNNTKSTEDLQLWEYPYNQTHNAVGIDIDGDGLDELAYYTLYSNNDETDGSLGSSCCVDIYKRVPDSSGNSNGDDPADVKYMWSKVHHFTTFMDEQTYVLNIPAAESKGYVSLAAGDYDGDGKEELAYYMPDKKGEDDSQDARVMVVKINEDNGVYSHRELGRIYLKDITSDYGKMGYVDAGIITDDYHLPTVALSTTSTRLGEVKNTSAGAKQYETHDDLVLTVSVPTMYHNRNLDLNSITTIYSFDGETVPDRIFREEYKPFNDNKSRMNYPNTCDADLNGDGFNEIVVAGIMEYDMNTPSGANDVNRNFGTLSNQKNYVNIISYTGSGYELLWSTPKEVDAPGNLSPQHYNSIEPTALCAGHFLCDTPAIKDQICIQGVILDCEGAKVSGAPVRTAQDGSGNNVAIITDTQPYHDKENFGSDVSFNKKYVYDITSEDTVNASESPWISQCVSGSFLDKTEVEQIAILSSDPVDANDDNIYMDFSIISHGYTGENATPEWTYRAYNDYINKKDEDDDGTSLFLAFINSDVDSYFYRYAGTYTSFSAPVLYTIMQAPPYYQEANSVANNKFSITSGVSRYGRLNLGLGGSVSEQQTAEVSVGPQFLGVGISVSIGASFGMNFAFNHSWTSQKSVTRTINVKTDNDYVVCYAVPMLVNYYEVVRTKDPNEAPEMHQVTEPMEPTLVALTLDEYNAAVSDALDSYDSNNKDMLSPDTNTPIINKSELPLSSAGDPVAYAHSLNDVFSAGAGKINSSDYGSTSSFINNSSNQAENSISFSSSTDNSIGATLQLSLSYTLGIRADVKVPAVVGITTRSNVSLMLSASTGFTVGSTDSSGVSYLMTYNAIKTTLPDGVSFSPYTESYSNSTLPEGATEIEHFNPNPDPDTPQDSMYWYETHEVCCPINYSTDKDNEYWAFINSFYTTPYNTPPEAPKEFAVKSVTKTDDGIAVTLIWNSAVRNQDRRTDGYNIYLKDSNPNQTYLHLQNTDNLIRRGNGEYTEYTINLKSNDYTDHLTFYIVPACVKSISGKWVAKEGILSESAEIKSVSALFDGSIRISKQPENAILSRNHLDETITFDIEAEKNEDSIVEGPVSFTWQQYDTATGKWTTVQDPENVNDAAEGKYKNTYSLTVPAEEKESFVNTGVRCIVNLGNYTVTSDLVTAVLDDDPRPLATIRYMIDEGRHLTFLDYEDGSLIGADKCHYSAGDTVKLTTDDNALFIHKGVEIIGEESGDITKNVDLVYDSTNKQLRFTMPDEYVTIGVPRIHEYNDNGFCIYCNSCQPPYKNSDGFYELANRGNFQWFVALVNNEPYIADFGTRDAGAKAVMTADIDLDSRTFPNIGEYTSKDEDIFTGVFDGQGHTLRNFYTYGIDNEYSVFGRIKGAEICNLTVTGSIDATNFSLPSKTLLGFIGKAEDSHIHDINCSIDMNFISSSQNLTVGGIAASAKNTTIERCVYAGTVMLNGYDNVAAGILADAVSSTEILNCANLGTITCDHGTAAGIIALAENKNNTISNCYNYGEIKGSSTTNASAISLSPSDKTSVSNCYYLSETTPEQVFTNHVTAKLAEQFASGEVGYLLNRGVTDGKQIWYQNIDNDAALDQYPLPSDSHGTVYRLGNTIYFSNDHEYLLGDANLDGKVNVSDVTAIQRHLAELEPLPKRQFAAADVNYSGNVTLLDATKLQRYLAEYDVDWGNQR